MRIADFGRRLIDASLLAASILLHAPCGGAEPPAQQPPPATTAQQPSGLPPGVEVQASTVRHTPEGDLILEGAPFVHWRGSRFQADRITVRQGRFIEAEGNVLVAWKRNRISGVRMSYDLEEDRGLIEEAVGQLEPDFYFTADRIEKYGEDRVFLDSATITTCTQPVPYWAFSVSSARIRIDGYARMWNLRLKSKRLPVFYLPYMVWPVKRERSAGLLFPNFGTTQDRGQVISEGLFIPLGQSADVTLIGEYYTEAGFGGGTQVRFVPNRGGFGQFEGYFINDDVFDPNNCLQPPCDRWRVTYKQTQKFRNGFRMIADINDVSDFDYFTDFERDLRAAASPIILARLEFSRNGRWTSVNVREWRREQLVSGGSLVQQTLPDVEFRGRSRRLGKTPFYLSYESSFTSIQQRGATIDADYLRGDVFPTLSIPVSPVPWLDINAVTAYRLTYYTQRRDAQTGGVVDGGITRGVGGGGLEIVGPRLFRIFGSAEREGSRFKHLIEPRIAYAFRQSFDRGNEVISFDEVDLIAPQNLLTFGIRSRLFARRPRAEQQLTAGSGEAIVMPDGESSSSAPAPLTGPARPPAPAQPAALTGPAEPLEIATLELTQSRSVDDFLSCADQDGDGIAEIASKASNVRLTGRLNPRPSLSFDLRGDYHALYQQLQSVSLSGNVRRRRARVGFSLVRRDGRNCSVSGTRFFPVEREDDTQLRLNTGFSLLRGKLRLSLDGSYLSNPGQDRSKIPDRRIQLEYYTQCCGFLVEYLARDFLVNDRREIRFTVDLRGVGKFLDFHHGEER